MDFTIPTKKSVRNSPISNPAAAFHTAPEDGLPGIVK